MSLRPQCILGFAPRSSRRKLWLMREKSTASVHLSFQEFLAAFYVFYYYVSMTMEVLSYFTALHRLFKGVVDKALESQNGQFDIFLRFLLGISLESNQGFLYGLLAHTESSSESIKEITRYIR